MASDDTDVRAPMRQFREPVVIAIVSLIMLSNILPRNPIWGWRTRGTMASQAAWEHGNRMGSLAMLAACGIWIVAGVYLPRRYVKPVGIAAVLLAVAIVFISQGWRSRSGNPAKANHGCGTFPTAGSADPCPQDVAALGVHVLLGVCLLNLLVKQ